MAHLTCLYQNASFVSNISILSVKLRIIISFQIHSYFRSFKFSRNLEANDFFTVRRKLRDKLSHLNIAAISIFADFLFCRELFIFQIVYIDLVLIRKFLEFISKIKFQIFSLYRKYSLNFYVTVFPSPFIRNPWNLTLVFL